MDLAGNNESAVEGAQLFWSPLVVFLQIIELGFHVHRVPKVSARSLIPKGGDSLSFFLYLLLQCFVDGDSWLDH